MRYLLIFASLSSSVAFFVSYHQRNCRVLGLNAVESPFQDLSNKISSQITSKTTAIQTTITETPKRVQVSVDKLVRLPGEVYNNATTTVNNFVADAKATASAVANLPTTTQIIIEETRQNISKSIDNFVYTVNTPRRVFASTWKSVSSLSRKAIDTVYDITDKSIVISNKPASLPKMISAKTKTQSFDAFKDNVYNFIDTTTAAITFLINAPGKVWRSVSSTATNTIECVTAIPDTVTNTAQTITTTAKTTQTNLQSFASTVWSIITFPAVRKFISEKSTAIDTVLSQSDDKELTPEKALKVMSVLVSDKKLGDSGEQKFTPSTIATTNVRATKPLQTKTTGPSIPNPFKLLQDISAEVKGFQKRLDENRMAQGLLNQKSNANKKQTLQPSAAKPIVSAIKEEVKQVQAPSAFVADVMEVVEVRSTLDDVVKSEAVKEEKEKDVKTNDSEEKVTN